MDERARDLEQLYRDRYSSFRSVAQRIVGDVEVAHEVVQEAFAQALRKRRSFRGDGVLEAWMWRIVVRLAWREKPARPGVTVHEAAHEDAHADHELRALVRGLSAKRREVVFLRYFADLSYAEIAAVCRVSEGTVAATLNQARRELGERLREQEAGT